MQKYFGRFFINFNIIRLFWKKEEKPSSKISNENVIHLNSDGYVKTQTFQLLETSYQAPSDTVLRVITKTDTTSVAAAKVASFVAVALFGGGTAQSTFSKHDLKGTKIDSVSNPSVSYFMPKFNDIIKENVSVKEKSDYREYPLVVKYSKFYLIYKELTGSSNYELIYDMTVSASYPGKYTLDCSFVSEPYSFEEWSANGYQKVSDIAKSKLDECLSDFNKESSLKSLVSDLENIKTVSSK